MSDKLTTRKYSEQLRRIANFLDSRPEFELEYTLVDSVPFYDKNKFIAAVKALGNVTKEYTEGELGRLVIRPIELPGIKFTIDRSSVCRKIVKYECDPLFSETEVEEL